MALVKHIKIINHSDVDILIKSEEINKMIFFAFILDKLNYKKIIELKISEK